MTISAPRQAPAPGRGCDPAGDSQAETIALLGAPATHGAAVERVETHISMIFLAGPYAYKLKRAVAFDYLDFSTPGRRRRCCDEEVRRNRRTAPDLYLGVLAVTREDDGRLALGGPGAPVDWVIKMRRFDQSQLFDRLAQRGALDLSLMDRLGRAIAAFHRSAPPRPDRGGRHGMLAVIDGNIAGLAEFGDAFDRRRLHELAAATGAALWQAGNLLDRRRRKGCVRECHGDLHLGNIVLVETQPTLFDAIEFNDDIACTDVLYDLAFLLMDLRHRRLERHANAVWNAYLEETRDYGGLALMPLFLSCRAAVRAKVSATASRLHHDPAAARELMRASHLYLDEATQLLGRGPAVAMAIGGVSGTGKSTLAAALAPHVGRAPGAVVLRSDVIRKELCGAGRFDRLGAGGYTPELDARVYAELAARTRIILAMGQSVIADAVFMREADRRAIEAAASKAGVALRGLWLDAPDEVLRRRLAHRADDPSEADAGVLAIQRGVDAGSIGWERLDGENFPDLAKVLPKGRANAGNSAVTSA